MTCYPAYFACTTPYQIIGAINITVSKNLTADLYVIGTFENHERIAKRLGELGVFRKVIDVSPEDYPIKHPRIDGAIQTIRAKAITKNFLEKDVCYETYYNTSYAHLKALLRHVLLERNPAMKSVIYDDGTGTYREDSTIFRKSASRAKLEKLLRWKDIAPENTSFLVNAPELLVLPEKLKSCKVERMPEMNDSAREAIKKLFITDEKAAIEKKYIIFDTVRGWNSVSDQVLPLLDSLYGIVADSVGKDNVICKPHPRTKQHLSIDVEEYVNTEVPMEALYAEMPDLEDRMLISYNSTAVFTPKMLFRKEPCIISLHKIVSKNMDAFSSYNDLLLRFKASYTDKDKIFIPENEEELKEYLKEYLEANKQ